jgi:hypothetical protein
MPARARTSHGGSIGAKKFRREDRTLVVYKRVTIDVLGVFMLTRRNLLLTSLTGLLVATEFGRTHAQSPAPNDPVAIITAIYTRVAKGKGDGGGGFVVENKVAKPNIFQGHWSSSGRRPTRTRRRMTLGRSISIQ